MTKQPPKKRKSLSPYVRFTGLAFQIGITIFLGNEFGRWLDAKLFPDADFFSKGLTLFAVFISVYAVITQAKKISK